MHRGEIVFPETTPETEWVRGRALQKISPTYRHGLTQRRVATALGAWAEASNRGRVATEWRCRVTPPGEVTRPLVPDVAYISFDVLSRTAGYDLVDVPALSPTLAVEIRSPDDRDDDVSDKIATYLSAGTTAVLVVDPSNETATFHDPLQVRSFEGGATVRHTSFPGFELDLVRLFAP